MKVRQLTEIQKDLISGQTYDGAQFFNPIQDADGNWIISNEEVNQCQNQEFTTWITTLSEIDYNPVVIDLLNL
jgi:hypothetical protein